MGNKRFYIRAGRTFAKSIIVNAIAFGPVITPMPNKFDTENIDNIGVRLGRFEMLDEIANFATILVSDMGNVVVGDTLYATGGSGNLDYHN